MYKDVGTLLQAEVKVKVKIRSSCALSFQFHWKRVQNNNMNQVMDYWGRRLHPYSLDSVDNSTQWMWHFCELYLTSKQNCTVKKHVVVKTWHINIISCKLQKFRFYYYFEWKYFRDFHALIQKKHKYHKKVIQQKYLTWFRAWFLLTETTNFLAPETCQRLRCEHS